MCFALRERARLWPQGEANREGKLHDYDDLSLRSEYGGLQCFSSNPLGCALRTFATIVTRSDRSKVTLVGPSKGRDSSISYSYTIVCLYGAKGVRESRDCHGLQQMRSGDI